MRYCVSSEHVACELKTALWLRCGGKRRGANPNNATGFVAGNLLRECEVSFGGLALGIGPEKYGMRTRRSSAQWTGDHVQIATAVRQSPTRGALVKAAERRRVALTRADAPAE